MNDKMDFFEFKNNLRLRTALLLLALLVLGVVPNFANILQSVSDALARPARVTHDQGQAERPAAGIAAREQALVINSDAAGSAAAADPTARRQALGEFYEGLVLETADSIDYDAAVDRSVSGWQALGEYYQYLSLTGQDPAFRELEEEVFIARWQALDEFHQDIQRIADEQASDLSAADLAAARRRALGWFYEELLAINGDPFDYQTANEIMAARWLVLGDFYQNLEQQSR